MPDFLLEIGAEEIPAGYIEPAMKALAASIGQQLDAHRIDHGRIRTFGTPRRLAVAVAGVAARQKPLVAELQGPPRKIAFGEDGRPTKAAVKFAEKAGVPLSALRVRETGKGVYVFAVRKEKGRATRKLLCAILPQVIASVPFPKSMRWGDLTVEFARPIQTLLALLGEQVVSFSYAGIKSGRFTLGHRFMHPGRLKIGSAAQYPDALRSAQVYADIEERRGLVRKAIAASAAAVGGSVLPDDELVDIVTNLVEYPAVCTGSFDRGFLELPDEVLITAMREHQKYFAVVDGHERLMPYFIAVNNTDVEDMQVVARGHQRVLRARLEDAKFFFNQDMQVPLDEQVKKLDHVLFQASLGSIGEKIERIGALAKRIAAGLPETPDLARTVARAAHLCKADLVTQMVGEFPKLQGIMGRVYAQRQGEDPRVCAVVEEHYRPVHSGAPLPETVAGAIVSVADKIDTICGCFSVGLLPSGTADPYALRRQGIGAIQIFKAYDLMLPLSGLIRDNLELLRSKATEDLDRTADQVVAFLQNRLANLLVEEGYAKDTVAAVLGASVDVIPDVWLKVAALEKLKTEPYFEPLAVAFKRVVNIIKKAEDVGSSEIRPGLFEDPAEENLMEALAAVRHRVLGDMQARQFSSALANIVTLKAPVDAFFEKVLVIADDPGVRRNRLALLGQIADLFNRFADFSKLAG